MIFRPSISTASGGTAACERGPCFFQSRAVTRIREMTTASAAKVVQGEGVLEERLASPEFWVGIFFGCSGARFDHVAAGAGDAACADNLSAGRYAVGRLVAFGGSVWASSRAAPVGESAPSSTSVE